MKLPGISGMRGFAMLLIVIYHLNQIRPIQNLALWNWKLYQFISLLPVVVSVFFLLSGLLRSLSYWKVIFDGGEIPPFWKGVKDRFFRIAPLFYLAVIFSFLWSISLGNPDWKSFFVGFTFFSWVHPSTFFPVAINGPLWYVAYDMIGNILVMVFMTNMLWCLKKFKFDKNWFIPLSFVFTFLILFVLHKVFISLPFPKLDGIVSVWFPYYNPFIFGTYYLFGAILAGVYLFLKEKNFNSSIIFDVIFFSALVVIGYFLYDIRGTADMTYSYPMSPYRFPFVPLLFAISIFSLLFSKFAGRWMDNNFLLFIAEISYPLYLFHGLVLAVFQKIFFPTGFSFGSWIFFSVFVVSFSLILSTFLMKGGKKLLAFLKKH